MKVNENELLERAAVILDKYRGLEILSEYAARLEIELAAHDPAYRRQPASEEMMPSHDDQCESVYGVLVENADAEGIVSMSYTQLSDATGIVKGNIYGIVKTLQQTQRVNRVSEAYGAKPAVYQIL